MASRVSAAVLPYLVQPGSGGAAPFNEWTASSEGDIAKIVDAPPASVCTTCSFRPDRRRTHSVHVARHRPRLRGYLFDHYPPGSRVRWAERERVEESAAG